MSSATSRTAFVTSFDSPNGPVLARKLQKNGFHVIAGSCDAERHENKSSLLCTKSLFGKKSEIELIQLDLQNEDSIEACARFFDKIPILDLIVVNSVVVYRQRHMRNAMLVKELDQTIRRSKTRAVFAIQLNVLEGEKIDELDALMITKHGVPLTNYSELLSLGHALDYNNKFNHEKAHAVAVPPSVRSNAPFKAPTGLDTILHCCLVDTGNQLFYENSVARHIYPDHQLKTLLKWYLSHGCQISQCTQRHKHG